MGEDINIERIECVRDLYQIDIRYEESGKGERLFITKAALFALITVAEKEEAERHYATPSPGIEA